LKTSAVPNIKQGSLTAKEIYLSVGIALSWWEASEDMIETLFFYICEMKEPIAVETFRVAPRQSRTAMLKSALTHHGGRLAEDEKATILDALGKLQALSSMRNQIAHGYVAEINGNFDGNTTMQGNFLSSTLSPTGILASRQDNKKYAHTAADIDEWRDKVRHERGRIMDVWTAIATRDQMARQNATHFSN
jgi:hypothetical protein